jgi:hypothetical protein
MLHWLKSPDMKPHLGRMIVTDEIVRVALLRGQFRNKVDAKNSLPDAGHRQNVVVAPWHTTEL